MVRFSSLLTERQRNRNQHHGHERDNERERDAHFDEVAETILSRPYNQCVHRRIDGRHERRAGPLARLSSRRRKMVSDLPQRRLAAAEGGYMGRRQSRPDDDGVAGRPDRCVVESCGREIGLVARYVGTRPVPAAAGTIVAGTVVPRATISRAIVPRTTVPRTVIAGTIRRPHATVPAPAVPP